MSFYNSRNSKLTLNNEDILATEAQINLQASITPKYLSQQRHSQEFKSVDGIGGNLSLNYFLTGTDPLKTYISTESSVISGNFGGLYFKSGYLKSYELNFLPNKAATVAAEIVFFDELKGIFAPTYENVKKYPVLNFSNIALTDPTNGSIGSLANINSLNYKFNSEILPLYLEGQTTPSRISFGVKEISLNLVTDNLSGDLPISGKSAGITAIFSHPELPALNQVFSVNGRLFQRNISTSVGGLTRSSLTIRQNYTDYTPSISTFTSTPKYPGETLQLIGNYLTNTTAVYIGHAAASYSVVSDTEITVTLPNDVVSGLITVYSYGGVVNSTTNVQPIYYPITVDKIIPPSGYISGKVLLSGSQFYNISNVVFNTGVSSPNFRVFNSGLLEAEIPENAAWGPIWVESSARNVSGLSTQKFVPIPRINRFTPTQGNTGDFVIIEGRGFSGVTGLLFNNLPNISPFTAVFTVMSNTGISGKVPSGNFRGNIKILAQSGISVTSNDSFGATINITGLSPTRSRTGEGIEILGSNFYQDILYPVNAAANQYLVSFNSISGFFTRVNSSRLTGLVPYGAQSGSVFVYDSNGSPFNSTGEFKLRHNSPTITSTVTETGFYSGYAIIEGTEFYEVSSIKLIGATGTITITSPTPYTNALGDIVSFQYPNATGGYYHVVVTTPEGVITGNSGVFIRDYPIRYNIYPSSGARGELITFSGRNLYPDSKVFVGTTGYEALILTGSVTTGHDVLKFYVPTEVTGALNNVILYNRRDWVTGVNALRLIALPSISGIFPISGAFGDSISISGSDLNNITGLYVGAQITTFTKINNTGITFTVPENAISNYITGLYNGGPVRSTGFFNVISPLMVLSGFTPGSGYWGDTIIISGSRLNYVDYVLFSGATGYASYNEGYFTSEGVTGIRMTIPNGAQTAPIKIQSDRFTVTSANNLIIIPTPVINSFFPNTGIFFDTIVSVSGSNLNSCSFLFPNINSGKYVSGTNLTIVNGTGVTFRVPREIVNGPIYVSGLGRIWGGTSGNFYPIPTIYGFTPTSLTTGATLTISGINAGSVLNSILFITGRADIQTLNNGSFSINYNQISGTGITNYTTGFTVMSVVTSGEFVRTGALFLINQFYSSITNVSTLLSSNYANIIGFQIATGNLTVTQGSPVLSSFTPTRGSSATSVVVTGDNLKTATGVYLISGATRTLGTITSSGQRQVTFNPPNFSQRSGQIQVFTEYGNATTVNYFTAIDALYFSGITPSANATGTVFLISGSGIRDVTGVLFGDLYSAPFSIRQIGTVYQVSGLVPMVNETYTRDYNVKILSEAGTITYNNFTIHPGPTQFYGIVSGREGFISTGFSIVSGLNSPFNSGVILTLTYTGQAGKNYAVFTALYQGVNVVVFSVTSGS